MNSLWANLYKPTRCFSKVFYINLLSLHPSRWGGRILLKSPATLNKWTKRVKKERIPAAKIVVVASCHYTSKSSAENLQKPTKKVSTKYQTALVALPVVSSYLSSKEEVDVVQFLTTVSIVLGESYCSAIWGQGFGSGLVFQWLIKFGPVWDWP